MQDESEDKGIVTYLLSFLRERKHVAKQMQRSDFITRGLLPHLSKENGTVFLRSEGQFSWPIFVCVYALIHTN